MRVQTAGMTVRLKREAGFTLTEMVIVVAIIGALCALAIPNYLDWNRKSQLREAVGNLYGNLQLARMSAMNQNTTVTVTVTQTSSTSPVTVTFMTAAGAAVLAPMTFVSGLSLTNASGASVSSPQVVQFTSAGRPVNPATSSANNLCITSTGAYVSGGCAAGTAPQALNFMNTNGVNYRIVITTTGKVSWCYSASCAQ